MVHAGVGEDSEALRRRAKVRLRWLVAAHAALATLPAASGLLPMGIRYYGGGYLFGRALEGLLLAQLMLLAFWAGLGKGRIVSRLVGVALGCVYLAIWPTIGSIILPWYVGGMRGGPRYPGAGRVWAEFPQTLFHFAAAIGIFIAALTAAFFMVRRWGNELHWRPDAESRPRGGALRYVVSGALAVTICVALLLISRYEMQRNGPYAWDGASEFACVAFPISTIYAVWAALGAGRVCRRVVLSFLFATLTELSILFGGVWANYAALRYYGALDWWKIPRLIIPSLLPIAILAATSLAVRACGYRFARRSATRRQFTLRELLAALTLGCAGLAFVVVPAERQRRAVAVLEAAGGELNYAQDIGESGETIWDLFPANCLRSWLPRDYFDNVHEVLLDGEEVTDALLVHLPALRDLEELSLWGDHITDAGLIHLGGLRRLRYLDLDGNPISDAGLANLRELTQLEHLDLGDTEITDAGMIHLWNLAKLESLFLNRTPITDKGLANLCKLNRLKCIWLNDTQITDAGLRYLHELPELKELSLNGAAVSDEGLAHLQGLTTLEGLWLENTRVTDAGLSRLEKLTRLRELTLYGTEVTEAGIARLREALPNARIHGP